ncbi:MAG: prepilin-type N-terminal cleavage/methylation domain-containing protein [Planctomycetes bacterium]|nr:prepilin-type N-terminal cleavage/methylation domain-containing protein [Planctomycetota bacterium]
MRNTASNNSGKPRRGFTLVEVLFSVLIMGVLIGLLYVGYRSSKTFASSAADKTAVSDIKVAVSNFNKEFGFLPPLVRDRNPTTRVSIAAAGDKAKIAVYDFIAPPDADRTYLKRGSEPAPTANNPFEDYRFSERTIAYFLAGACDTPRNLNEATAELRALPIDGVAGPGMYKPLADGTFDIPKDVKDPSHDGTVAADKQRRRVGKRFEPLVDLNGKRLKLTRLSSGGEDAMDRDNSGNDAGENRLVAITDAKEVPVRYYRWIIDGKLTDTNGYRLPPMVGRQADQYGFSTPPERDTLKNTELRSATFAIVAAGPNGAFGDEDDATLFARMGETATGAGIIKLRIKAEADNIVEVGR